MSSSHSLVIVTRQISVPWHLLLSFLYEIVEGHKYPSSSHELHEQSHSMYFIDSKWIFFPVDEHLSSGIVCFPQIFASNKSFIPVGTIKKEKH